MEGLSEERVLAALSKVQDPELHRDIVSLGMVKNLAVNEGRVRFTVELTTPACPLRETIETDCKKALAELGGITALQIDFGAQVRGSKAGAVEGPPNPARADPFRPPCRLCLAGSRDDAARGERVHRGNSGKRRPPCADGWRDRNHDASRHDARESRTYGQGDHGRSRDRCHLPGGNARCGAARGSAFLGRLVRASARLRRCVLERRFPDVCSALFPGSLWSAGEKLTQPRHDPGSELQKPFGALSFYERRSDREVVQGR